MFRPGDRALVRSTNADVVIVTAVGRAWATLDSDGRQSTLEENDLQMAHPTVLASIRAEETPKEVATPRWAFLFNDPLSEEFVNTTRMYGFLSAIKDRDHRGHWKSGRLLDQRRLDSLFAPVFFKVDKDDAKAILACVEGQPLDRWVPVIPQSGMVQSCPNCDMRTVRLETDGRTIRVVGLPCPNPEGVGATAWELNVPSGEIVVANDLRDLFPLPRDEDDDYDIGTAYGRGQTSLAYASIGMSHASVGNTSPGVYRVSAGRYRIATSGKNRVASIRTALWWYSICDHDEYQRRCARFGLEPKGFDGGTLVEVPPGVYRFEHRDDEKTRRSTGSITFATFHRVREPDPVVDLLRSYEEVEVNAHAFVRAKAARWPTLYAKADSEAEALPWEQMSQELQTHAWREVALHTLFSGSGVEWHERGFPRCRVDAAVADEAPPKFRSQYRWGSLSDYGLLGETPIRDKVRLSASFARLAFECLESVISFGVKPDDRKHLRDVGDARREMRTAVRFYRNLLKEHPTAADPTFARWVTEDGRAEAWVERFDLGPGMLPKHREYLQSQRWVPEGTFGVEFDARKLASGQRFAHHPKQGGKWTRKEDASRWAIERWDREAFWNTKADETSVPLYVVARVVGLGGFSHLGHTLVEVEFDYGTEWMRDRSSRKALIEQDWKDAIRPLALDEYASLLPAAAAFYREGERTAGVDVFDEYVDTSDWKVRSVPPAPQAPPDADWHLEPDEVKP